jgi:hypothetical protein
MKRLKKAFTPGAHVTWTGGEHGVIRKVFTHRVERTMKGATVIHPANRKDPAYLIEQSDGDTLLKNHSELRAA